MSHIHISFIAKWWKKELSKPHVGYRKNLLLWLCIIFVTLIFFNACQPVDIQMETQVTGQSKERAKDMKPSEPGTMMVPPRAEVVYRENGTPARIKGDNLSELLESSSEYRNAQKQNDYGEMVFIFLEYFRKAFKLVDPRMELVHEKEKSDSLDTTHVFLQQMAGNIPVCGKNITVHFNKEKAIYLVQGDYVPSLSDVDTVPKITDIVASQYALTAAPATQSQWTVQDRSLCLYMTPSHTPRLVYGITLAQGITGRELYYVDAENGEILHRFTLIAH